MGGFYKKFSQKLQSISRDAKKKLNWYSKIWPLVARGQNRIWVEKWKKIILESWFFYPNFWERYLCTQTCVGTQIFAGLNKNFKKKWKNENLMWIFMILVFFTNDQVVERRASNRTYPSIILSYFGLFFIIWCGFLHFGLFWCGFSWFWSFSLMIEVIERRIHGEHIHGLHYHILVFLSWSGFCILIFFIIWYWCQLRTE